MRNSILMVLVMLSLCCSLAFAQSNVSSGEIKGTVRDKSGAVVPGAVITVANTNTGLARTQLTAVEGTYRILLLPPGLYDVKAELEGFVAQVKEKVEVTVGQTVMLDFQLHLEGFTLAITVTGETPLIETEKAQQSETINERYINSLPIDRRDYLDFTLLAPGVADSNALADNTDFRIAQTPHSGISFYGSNGRGNSVTIDGAETNDAVGGVRHTLGQDAIQEFQINRSNYSAELGGASGGVINIVSKSGSNRIRGSVFGYFRHEKLDAANPFAVDLINGNLQRVKPPSNRQQYGATLGFPIIRDRTFLFGSFEGLNRNESSAVSILTTRSIFEPTPDQATIIGSLASNPSPVPIPCLPLQPSFATLPASDCAQVLTGILSSNPSTVELFESNSGVFPFTTNSKSFSFRLDHSANYRNQFFLRYSYANSGEDNQSTLALLGISRSNNIDILDSNIVGGWTFSKSSKFVNQAHIQWNYRNFIVSPSEPYGPEFNITGFGFFNRDKFLPSLTIERRYEFADSISYLYKNHRFKFGATILVRGNRSDTATFFGGRFGFGELPGFFVSPQFCTRVIQGQCAEFVPITSLQAFDLGLPQYYQQGFGDPTVSSTDPTFGFYAQDTWNVSNDLTLNLGLRYELDDRRDPIPTDKSNFAPRFGFAWKIGGSGRTILRGGFGIFYSPIYYQIEHVANSLNEIDGFRQMAQILSPLDAANPFAQDGPINIWRTLRAQGVIGVPVSQRTISQSDLQQFGIEISHTGPRPPGTLLFRTDPNYRSPYSQQASLGIQHEITAGLAVSANYIFARTLKIPRARDRNILSRPVGPKGIPEWTAASGCVGLGIFECFRDPFLLQENVYESSANAFYHGMILEVNRRFRNHFSLVATYTFSKAIDQVTDFNSDFQAMDQTNLRAERALSPFDQRHKVVIYANLESPYRTSKGNSVYKNILADFSLAPIFRANSGRPFNLLAGTDVNGDRHSTTDRPIFAGRNTGKGPVFSTFDLRVGRTIYLGSESRSLQLTIETFNLFNRLNPSSVNNTVGPGFTGPFDISARKDLGPSSPLGYTSAFEARRIQIGVRINF